MNPIYKTGMVFFVFALYMRAEPLGFRQMCFVPAGCECAITQDTNMLESVQCNQFELCLLMDGKSTCVTELLSHGQFCGNGNCGCSAQLPNLPTPIYAKCAKEQYCALGEKPSCVESLMLPNTICPQGNCLCYDFENSRGLPGVVCSENMRCSAGSALTCETLDIFQNIRCGFQKGCPCHLKKEKNEGKEANCRMGQLCSSVGEASRCTNSILTSGQFCLGEDTCPCSPGKSSESQLNAECKKHDICFAGSSGAGCVGSMITNGDICNSDKKCGCRSSFGGDVKSNDLCEKDEQCFAFNNQMKCAGQFIGFGEKCGDKDKKKCVCGSSKIDFGGSRALCNPKNYCMKDDKNAKCYETVIYKDDQCKGENDCVCQVKSGAKGADQTSICKKGLLCIQSSGKAVCVGLKINLGVECGHVNGCECKSGHKNTKSGDKNNKSGGKDTNLVAFKGETCHVDKEGNLVKFKVHKINNEGYLCKEANGCECVYARDLAFTSKRCNYSETCLYVDGVGASCFHSKKFLLQILGGDFCPNKNSDCECSNSNLKVDQQKFRLEKNNCSTGQECKTTVTSATCLPKYSYFLCRSDKDCKCGDMTWWGKGDNYCELHERSRNRFVKECPKEVSAKFMTDELIAEQLKKIGLANNGVNKLRSLRQKTEVMCKI